jgi:predicted nucleic acid-binding protein
MSQKKKEFLIDTDVLSEHLTCSGTERSFLEKALECGICFTTVINSAEIYFALRNPDEKQAIDALMKIVNVLGFHARYSLLVDELIGKVNTVRDALFCATAKISRLTIVTRDIKRYQLAGVEVIDPINL